MYQILKKLSNVNNENTLAAIEQVTKFNQISPTGLLAEMHKVEETVYGTDWEGANELRREKQMQISSMDERKQRLINKYPDLAEKIAAIFVRARRNVEDAESTDEIRNTVEFISRNLSKYLGVNEAVSESKKSGTGINEGAMKDVDIDIQELTDAAFKKKYNMTKQQAVKQLSGQSRKSAQSQEKEVKEGKLDDLRDRLQAKKDADWWGDNEKPKAKVTSTVHKGKYGAEYQDDANDNDDDNTHNNRKAKKTKVDDTPKKRGRPKGSKQATGAKSPTGKSRLMREEFGDLDSRLIQKIIRGDIDIYDVLAGDYPTYPSLTRELQKMYDRITSEQHLHPDDDFEDIINLMHDEIKSSMGHAAQKGKEPASREVAIVTKEDDDHEDEEQGFFVAIGSEDDGGFVGMIVKDGGKWREVQVSGNAPYNWGGKSYMSYLSPDDVMAWIRGDYRNSDVAGPFSDEQDAMEYAQSQYGLDPVNEEVDTGQANARRSVPASKKEQEKTFSNFQKRLKKEKEDHNKAKAVEETTTSGSVATASAGVAKPSDSMQVGKGIYDSINRDVEKLIAESMNVSVNVGTDSTGNVIKNVSVNADGDDADMLAQMLKMAGIGSNGYKTIAMEPDSTCTGLEEENLANEPDEQYADTDTMVNKLSGGLNKQHMQVNPNNPADNPLAMRKLGRAPSGQIQLGEEEAKIKQGLLDLYKKYQG